MEEREVPLSSVFLWLVFLVNFCFLKVRLFQNALGLNEWVTKVQVSLSYNG